MDSIYQIAVIVIAAFILTEVGTAIYIYRNRRTMVPRLRAGLRNLLGLNQDQETLGSAFGILAEEMDKLHGKINYIGRHTKFERQQLRKMGMLKDEPKSLRRPQ